MELASTASGADSTAGAGSTVSDSAEVRVWTVPPSSGEPHSHLELPALVGRGRHVAARRRPGDVRLAVHAGSAPGRIRLAARGTPGAGSGPSGQDTGWTKTARAVTPGSRASDRSRSPGGRAAPSASAARVRSNASSSLIRVPASACVDRSRPVSEAWNRSPRPVTCRSKAAPRSPAPASGRPAPGTATPRTPPPPAPAPAEIATHRAVRSQSGAASPCRAERKVQAC